MMKKRRKNKDLTLGRVISAIIFAVLMSALIVFTMYYDPSKQYSNSFFDDVSKVMNWQD
jgi:hypothetical protein